MDSGDTFKTSKCYCAKILQKCFVLLHGLMLCRDLFLLGSFSEVVNTVNTVDLLLEVKF